MQDKVKISITKLSVAMIRSNIESGKQLAKASGVSVNTISRLRNGGSAKLPTLQRLSAALGVDPADIIEEERR